MNNKTFTIGIDVGCVESIEDSWWGVNCLRQFGHRIIFITTFKEGSSGSNYRWLQENNFLPNIKDYIETGDKSLIYVDYLVDDIPVNVENTRGAGILFSRPHNAYFNWNLKMNDWTEIAKYFMSETNRVLLYG